MSSEAKYPVGDEKKPDAAVSGDGGLGKRPKYEWRQEVDRQHFDEFSNAPRDTGLRWSVPPYVLDTTLVREHFSAPQPWVYNMGGGWQRYGNPANGEAVFDRALPKAYIDENYAIEVGYKRRAGADMLKKFGAEMAAHATATKAQMDEAVAKMQSASEEAQQRADALKKQKAALDEEKKQLDAKFKKQQEELEQLKKGRSEADQKASDELQVKMAELEALNTRLNAMNEEYDKTLVALRSATTQAEDEKRERESAESKSAHDRKALEDCDASKAAEATEFQRQIETKQREIDQIKDELEAKRKNLSDCHRRVSELEEAVEQGKATAADLSAARAELSACSSNVQQLSSDLSIRTQQLREQTEKAAQEAKSAEETIQQLDTQHTQELVRRDASMSELEGKLRDSFTTRDQLWTQLQKCNRENTDLNQRLAQTIELGKQVDAQMKAASEGLHAVRVDLSACISEHRRLQAMLASSEQQRATLLVELKRINDTAGLSQQQLVASNSRVSELESELDKATKVVAGLQRDVDANNADMKARDRHVEKLKGDISGLKAQKERLQQLQQQLQGDLESKSRETTDLDARLRESQKKASDASARVAWLEAQQKELNLRLAEYQQTEQGLRGELVRVTDAATRLHGFMISVAAELENPPAPDKNTEYDQVLMGRLQWMKQEYARLRGNADGLRAELLAAQDAQRTTAVDLTTCKEELARFRDAINKAMSSAQSDAKTVPMNTDEEKKAVIADRSDAYSKLDTNDGRRKFIEAVPAIKLPVAAAWDKDNNNYNVVVGSQAKADMSIEWGRNAMSKLAGLQNEMLALIGVDLRIQPPLTRDIIGLLVTHIVAVLSTQENEMSAASMASRLAKEAHDALVARVGEKMQALRVVETKAVQSSKATGIDTRVGEKTVFQINYDEAKTTFKGFVSQTNDLLGMLRGNLSNLDPGVIANLSKCCDLLKERDITVYDIVVCVFTKLIDTMKQVEEGTARWVAFYAALHEMVNCAQLKAKAKTAPRRIVARTSTTKATPRVDTNKLRFAQTRSTPLYHHFSWQLRLIK